MRRTKKYNRIRFYQHSWPYRVALHACYPLAYWSTFRHSLYKNRSFDLSTVRRTRLSTITVLLLGVLSLIQFRLKLGDRSRKYTQVIFHTLTPLNYVTKTVRSHLFRLYSPIIRKFQRFWHNLDLANCSAVNCHVVLICNARTSTSHNNCWPNTLSFYMAEFSLRIMYSYIYAPSIYIIYNEILENRLLLLKLCHSSWLIQIWPPALLLLFWYE